MLEFLMKGALIGFAIAMPVGPIGLLCIRNSLYHGFRYGFMTGIGAAGGDTFYGAIAAFGIAALSAFIETYDSWFHLFGGIFLCVLGVNIFLKHGMTNAPMVPQNSTLRVVVTTFFLTVTNPLTILSFAGAFAAVGVESSSLLSASLMTVGVFIGSLFWWLILTSSTALFKKNLAPNFSKWLNRISGLVLFLFGLAAFYIFAASFSKAI